MGKKKYPKAIKYYTKAIKIDPKNASYTLNRAIANAALELWKDAEADADVAVSLADPAPAKSHYQLARARLRRGRCEEAREAVRRGLATHPGEPALTQLSNEIDRACLEQEARRKREEEARAVRPAQGPDDGGNMLRLARSAYAAGNLQEAAQLLRDGIESSTDAGTRKAQLSLLAKACMQLKQWSEAVEAFEKLVELEEATLSLDSHSDREKMSVAYNSLGVARRNAGQYEKAAEALNMAYHRATNGDDQVATPLAAQVLQNIGQCFKAQGKNKEALGVYERGLELGQRLYGDSHASQSLNHLCVARCHRDMGQFKEAVEAYAKAHQIWTSKDLETCLQETPDVPNKERLVGLQKQCENELAQLVLVLEEAKRRAESGELEADTSVR